jgi:hypothetical protein
MLGDLAGVLLVANATSLGWGLRGEWGHWWGATVPGALAGMSLWVAFGDANSIWQMLALGSVLAVALSIGGVMSYGLIVGYATGEPGRDQRSTRFGSLGLFLVGGLWGLFCGAALGLVVTERSYTLGDLSLWAVLASSGAVAGHKLLVQGLGLRLSPPRSDAWASVLGGAAGTCIYFAGTGDATVLSFSIAGMVGFGAGFSLGAVVHREGNKWGWNFSSWKFMEHNVGFFGGLALVAWVLVLGDGISGAPVGKESRLLVVLTFWLVTYMVLNNNIEHWTFETRWLPRRAFSLFQISALASLPVVGWFMLRTADGPGAGGQKVLFTMILLLYTAIGTAKFLHTWSAIKSRVVATFVAQLAICLLLLVLL